ncbi:MAG: hypothetical protein LBG66_03195 [Gallionellaceae bacterium]|jgi:hypothetical protein|nr:hypothetical protein [Gallionellaceae bacterium]
MEYTLDTDAAKAADNISARIEEKGSYLGKFTRAEAVTSKNGAEGIDFSFVTADGMTANYLTVWTYGRDGAEIHGYKLLMAIMTCLRVKTLQSRTGTTEKYNADIQRVEKVEAQLFPELMDKPIGLLLHMEEYEKTKGGTAWKPAISMPYDKDGFTASEILSQAKVPATLEKAVKALRDRPLKSAPASSAGQPEQQYGGSAFADLSEDIPF